MKKVAIALGLSVVGAFACVTFRNSVEDKLPLTVIRALRVWSISANTKFADVGAALAERRTNCG